MRYRTLRGTGCRVSRICLGTMTMGNQLNESDSIRMVHQAIDSGINFIDTADAYNGGLTETILGKALKDRRDGIVLAGKVRWRCGGSSFKDQGLSRWHIIRGVEASLKRLGTDCLDILFLHSPDYSVPLEESLEAVDYLIRQGKVMYLGMSNYAAWQICKAKGICDKKNLHSPVVSQVVYNMLTRGIENEFIPFCRDMNVGITVYNPLASGLLTGKHDFSKAPVEGTRFQMNKEYFNRYWNDSNFEAVSEMIRIANEAGMKPIELAYRWLAAQDAIDSIIMGASKLEQFEENISSWEGELDKNILDACDAIWDKVKGNYFQYNR